ncbi:MAG: hypothetical protein HYV14_14045 [Elusimicrobia bacterium]|nr:hypothetical protein [Elusimicrobiota bacterium]
MSDHSEPDTRPPLVAVYEAVNDNLKEAYLGITGQPYDSVAARFRRSPPPPASHWDPDHAVSVNVVENSLRLDDARDFIVHYAASLEAVGWRTIREDR